jgi:hypothetical protein
LARPCVICFTFFVATSIVHTLSPPLRSDVNTMLFPSGL